MVLLDRLVGDLGLALVLIEAVSSGFRFTSRAKPSHNITISCPKSLLGFYHVPSAPFTQNLSSRNTTSSPTANKTTTMQSEAMAEQNPDVQEKALSRLSFNDDSSHSQDESTTTVDLRGDLTLNIGLSSNKFIVCSRTLSRISPVLERMLYGSFAESKSSCTTNWTIDLPDINPLPFVLLAYVSHGKFGSIPKTLHVDELFELINLTHYYDCTQVLAPWADHWLSSVREPASSNELEMYKVLFICQELGDKRTFEITARRLVLESCSTIERERLHERLGGHLCAVIDRIDSIRENTINAMLGLFRDLSNILVVVDEQPRWCRYASYMCPHRCESMILGSVVFCLTRANLWPIPEAQDVDESVMALYRQLANIVIHDIGQGEKKGNDHAKCNPRGFLLERLQRILADMPDPLVEGERAYVVKQRVALGLLRSGRAGDG